MDVAERAVRAWRVAREMLVDRDVDATSAVAVGDGEVQRLASELATFAIDINPTTVVVFHSPDFSLKKEDLFAITGAATHAILIMGAVPSGASRKSLEAAALKAEMHLEFFTLLEMQYNVSKHTYVPEHRRLSEAEEDEVLKLYALQSRFQLHIILTSDPMARYLGLRHGNIVRIERHSGTAGTCVDYRCCGNAAV